MGYIPTFLFIYVMNNLLQVVYLTSIKNLYDDIQTFLILFFNPYCPTANYKSPLSLSLIKRLKWNHGNRALIANPVEKSFKSSHQQSGMSGINCMATLAQLSGCM